MRERLVYIEPARNEIVLPFNPLLHDSPDQLYYQVARAAEIVLRGWASQNIEEMPRLRNWVFASFFAAGRMGLPISTCRYLLRPGSAEHAAILQKLPGELQNMWGEVLRARGNEALRLLESTRNRLAPFFDSGILRRMFSSVQSRFDVERFIRERRIVILNVGGYRQLDSHISHTIGGLAVNEILQTAMNLPPEVVRPTCLLLDEFQHFVGGDLYEALPLVRQLGLRLILSHQSFSQLERGDIDLTSIIWQARSRIMFANDAEDADILADEIAKLTFDPYRLKEELKTRRQRIVGHRREFLHTKTKTKSQSHGFDQQQGTNYGMSGGQSSPLGSYRPTFQQGTQHGHSQGRSEKTGTAHGESEAISESLVPIHEDFEETANKSYFSFDEQKLAWARKIRELVTGEAFCKLKGDSALYHVRVNRPITRNTPRMLEKRDELIAKNFASEFFLTKSQVEAEEEKVRKMILGPSTLELGSLGVSLAGPESTIVPEQIIPKETQLESEQRLPSSTDQDGKSPSPPSGANPFM